MRDIEREREREKKRERERERKCLCVRVSDNIASSYQHHMKWPHGCVRPKVMNEIDYLRV